MSQASTAVRLYVTTFMLLLDVSENASDSGANFTLVWLIVIVIKQAVAVLRVGSVTFFETFH